MSLLSKLGKRKKDGRGAHFSKKARLEASQASPHQSTGNKTQNSCKYLSLPFTFIHFLIINN